MKILDCTLRDGGYYTNWDFENDLLKTYFRNIDKLPIDFIEVGYRNKFQPIYFGQFYFTPTIFLEEIKKITSKPLAIILNEKDIRSADLKELLTPIIPFVELVRLAIDPSNMLRAIALAAEIKKLNFKVAFNVMYMSNWEKFNNFFEDIKEVNHVADFFYMVDSFGGVFPEDVARITQKLKQEFTGELGFHGHNNLELALINTLTALENGVSIVDATITGMGRGAGNLKTELLLTALNANKGTKVNFDALSEIVASFEDLQKEHQWGTSLPYMVSGANSLPQKEVMEWMSKRYYSLNSIIRALTNQSKGQEDNLKLNVFAESKTKTKEVLIVGGGVTIKQHAKGLTTFLNQQKEIKIIHSSSKNAMFFKDIPNEQLFCLLGNEGHRLERVFDDLRSISGFCVLPPYPRKMGTYIPSALTEKSYELNAKDSVFGSISQTAMSLELALKQEICKIYLIGFDGYSGENISLKDQELFIENEELFQQLKKKGVELVSLTPTRYKSPKQMSVYSII